MAQCRIDRYHHKGQCHEGLGHHDSGESEGEVDAQGVEKRGEVALATKGCGKGQTADHRWHSQRKVDQKTDDGAAAAELLHPAFTEIGASGRSYDRDEIRHRVGAFRRKVETESARRNAEVRGRDRISRYGVRDPLERKDFLLTGKTEAAELHAVIAPLSRKLAAKLAARQRRQSRGTIDIRRTLRAAMSTGGVPVRPAYKRRTRSRADIVLLCDMSGSVAGFSRFTMLLLQSLAGVFRRVRFIGFVNTCDDITELVREAQVGEDISERVAREAQMTRWHGSSDYGAAFEDAVEHHLDAIGPRSTVLILGDARTNGTDPRIDRLRILVSQARYAAWLNPEAERMWDTGDSVASRYAEVVDMHEVRNIEQLRQFVSRLPVS